LATTHWHTTGSLARISRTISRNHHGPPSVVVSGRCRHTTLTQHTLGLALEGFIEHKTGPTHFCTGSPETQHLIHNFVPPTTRTTGPSKRQLDKPFGLRGTSWQARQDRFRKLLMATTIRHHIYRGRFSTRGVCREIQLLLGTQNTSHKFNLSIPTKGTDRGSFTRTHKQGGPRKASQALHNTGTANAAAAAFLQTFPKFNRRELRQAFHLYTQKTGEKISTTHFSRNTTQEPLSICTRGTHDQFHSGKGFNIPFCTQNETGSHADTLPGPAKTNGTETNKGAFAKPSPQQTTYQREREPFLSEHKGGSTRTTFNTLAFQFPQRHTINVVRHTNTALRHLLGDQTGHFSAKRISGLRNSGASPLFPQPCCHRQVTPYRGAH